MSQRIRHSGSKLLRALPAPLRRLLARPALRAFEAFVTFRARGDETEHPLGADADWPLPPARLRVKVSWSADPRFFLDGGREHARLIRDLLARDGASVQRFEAILDFGCGCGRVTRWWSDVPAQLHGCDADDELVAWCQAQLPRMTAAVTHLEPPTPYEPESFDLIYALSVFTHIPEALQRPWIEELMRLLRPGGYLFLTVSGNAYREQLSPSERTSFAVGELTTRFDELAGTNLCTAYHPPVYVTSQLLSGATIVQQRLADTADDGQPFLLLQDSYLARKPGVPAPAD